MEKSQHFHRAMEVNISIGSECMRLLTKEYLTDKGVTLQQHLNEPQVKKSLGRLNFYPEQKQILNGPDPQINAMDVSLISSLLLNTFPGQITAGDKSSVEGLREKRNKLSHQVKAELNDDTIFKESSQYILKISKSINQAYYKNVAKQIKELQRRELVSTCSGFDRILVNNEVYMLKLVESSAAKELEKNHELLIKFGLTKWIRQLCRGIDAVEFLQILRSQNIINDQEKREFEQEYSNEGQIRRLVLYMVTCADKDNLYKMCRCLRQVSPHLADIVENSESDGQEIGKITVPNKAFRIATEEHLKHGWTQPKIGYSPFYKSIQMREETIKTQYLNKKALGKVKKALQGALERCPDGYISTEEIHIYVEETVGDLFNFEMIRDCLINEFPDVHYTPPDCSFTGVTWKRNVLEEVSVCKIEKESNVYEFSCEEFAEYIGKYFRKRRLVLEKIFRNAILDESLSAATFVAMTQEQMETIFTPYLSAASIKYGGGIKMDMHSIQSQIRKSINEVNISEDSSKETLRMFDTPVGKKIYMIGLVKASTGNLLIPRHEFVDTSSYGTYFKNHIIKDVVRFTAACINGRQNGTIHFGIIPLKHEYGKILGIPKDIFNAINLNDEITTALKTCFGENVSTAILSIRPVQIVPVETGDYVIEFDIVPFSCHLSPHLLQINYPPKGSQSPKNFMFDNNEIITISAKNVVAVRDVCKKLLKIRDHLEDYRLVCEKKGYSTQSKLKQLLTRGNKYIKDELIPIFISGRISDSEIEMDIRERLDIDRALSSAEVVLDFDSSVKLRDKVEGSRTKLTKFLVQTAENLLDTDAHKIEKIDIQSPPPTWLYCNGNDEIHSPPFALKEWVRERSHGVKTFLSKIRKMIPKDRGILIFLVFDIPRTYQDALFEITRDALLFTFRGECLIISTKEEHVAYLKREVSRTLDDSTLDSCFLSGLSWDEVSTIINSVFRVNEDVVCRLPCSTGHYKEMSAREKSELKLSEIEILSGEQCLLEEEKMSDYDRKSKRHESQKFFYKGGLVSWWNFYYRNQVGTRDHFELHRAEMKEYCYMTKEMT